MLKNILTLSKTVESSEARNLIRGMSVDGINVNKKIFRKLQKKFPPKIFGQSVLFAGRSGYLPWLDLDETNNDSWRSLFVSPSGDAPKEQMLVAYFAARFETHRSFNAVAANLFEETFAFLKLDISL